jgi:hypothetical protein
MQELMKLKGDLGDEALEYIKSVQNLEFQYKEISNQMQLMKRNEIDRINKEFYTNDYQRRFRVEPETVISALIGEDNTSSEMARMKRERKIYFQKLENIRNFNFLENVNKKYYLHNTENSNFNHNFWN